VEDLVEKIRHPRGRRSRPGERAGRRKAGRPRKHEEEEDSGELTDSVLVIDDDFRGQEEGAENVVNGGFGVDAPLSN